MGLPRVRRLSMTSFINCTKNSARKSKKVSKRKKKEKLLSLRIPLNQNKRLNLAKSSSKIFKSKSYPIPSALAEVQKQAADE